MTVSPPIHQLCLSELQSGQVVKLEDDLGGETQILVIDPVRSIFRRLHADALDPSDATGHIHVLAGDDDGNPHQTLRPGERLHLRYSNGREVYTRRILHVTIDNDYPLF